MGEGVEVVEELPDEGREVTGEGEVEAEVDDSG